MRTYAFMQVDAFTSQPLTGNACAVVFDADDLDADTMLAIAREQNLSETAFVSESRLADFRVRYFTPVEEIPLAGHPTIATAHALVDSQRLALRGDRTATTFELRDGPIEIEIVASNSGVDRIVMSQRKPEFGAQLPPDAVLTAFGLQPEGLLPSVPVQVVSTGTPQLMVPLRDLSSVRRATLDTDAYNELRSTAGFFSAHLFCLQGISADAHTFARHFVTPPQLIEDPFTGSATGGMGAYVWHHGLLEQAQFVAEQGHDMRRPGRAVVEVVGPRDDIRTVKVGGPAVTVIRGTLTLES